MVDDRPAEAAYGVLAIDDHPVESGGSPAGGASAETGHTNPPAEAFGRYPMPNPRARLAQVQEELVAWVKTLVSAAVYAVLIVTFVFQVARVEGQSMAPTLEDQDRLIVNKLAYRMGEPRRGDIVMLYYPLNPDKSFVKRVIAEEGDTVRIVDGHVYVNDIPLQRRLRAGEVPQPRRLGTASDPGRLRLRDGRPPQQQLRQPSLG